MSESVSVPRDLLERLQRHTRFAKRYYRDRAMDESQSAVEDDRDAVAALLAAADTAPEPGYMIKSGDETQLEPLQDGTLRCPTCEATYIPDGSAVLGVDGEPG